MKKIMFSILFLLTIATARLYDNYIKEGQRLTLHFTIRNKTHLIYENKNILFRYSLQQEEIEFNAEVDSFAEMDNITMHAAIYREGETEPLNYISKNMSRYAKVGSGASMMALQGVEDKQTQETVYSLKLPPKFNLLMIHLTSKIRDFSFLSRFLNFDHRLESNNLYYVQNLDASQLHIPYKTYVPATQNHTKHNITVSLSVYSFTKFQMFFGFTQPQMLKDQNPLMAEIWTDDMLDFVKQILFTNNFYIVLLYFILSTTQTFMQIFAFKNEIQVWKNVQKKGGLSIKSLYQNLLCSVIICLYLHNQQASNFYIFFNLLDLVLTLWKIFKAVAVKVDSIFPFIHFSYKPWYHNKTQSVDSEAMHYTSYLIAALYGIFLVYKLYPVGYDLYLGSEFKIPSVRKVYTFMLQISVGFIFTLGFVMMTPQLYINYKLKSVDHLPWKTLIYRFISTIIDDVFVFMVSVPWLHRVFCFRDDVIFILYLVQRKMYHVDKNRIALSTTSVDLSKTNNEQHLKTQ